jgi:hypothetical protein
MGVLSGAGGISWHFRQHSTLALSLSVDPILTCSMPSLVFV